MGIKARRPDRLGYTDYISFYLELIDIRGRLIATGEWPMHLDTDLTGLRDELTDAYADYEGKRQHLVKTATPTHDAAALKVYKRIRSLKLLLPTIFGGDETVLTEFGINEKVPSDKDDLFIMAKNCLDHWNELCDPAMPPEYAPVAGFFTEYATEFADFEAAHEAHIDATREKEIAETLVDVKREACHVAERLIFSWFRGIHLNPEEKWWEDTPWGTSSGGGEEPGGELPELPAAPTGFAVELRMEPSPFMLISCDDYGEHSGFDILRAETPADVTEPPEMPGELFFQNTGLPLMDGEINPGMKYWYQIRARNGEEVGEWTEIVGEEYK
ncbi:hypothetical protein J7L01_07920 [bacterium]|nr:hypothetical protein [bacterium]